jgi:hypothetical protein
MRQFVVLAVLAFCSSLAGAEEDDDFCGKPRHVAEFTINHGGSRYALPAYVKIQKDAATLFEDQLTSEWRPPYNGVEYSSFGQYLLVQTFEQDCVDVYFARLFMISPDGSVVHQPVWTSNWRAGFFVAEGKLTYWSEWFCQSNNSEREEGTSYVYAFSEPKRTFVRQDVDDSVYCARSADLEFIRFVPAQASP